MAVGKWIALTFGPSGTALFGQLMNLYTGFSTIPFDGLGRAAIKEGSLLHQNGNETEARTLVSSGYTLLVLILGFEWLVALFIAYFTNWFYPFNVDGLLFWYFLAFGCLATGYFISSIFLIWKKIKIQAYIVSAMSFGGLLGVLFSYSFDFGFQQTLLTFLIGQIFLGLMVILLVRKKAHHVLRFPGWQYASIKNLLTFTLTFSLATFITQIGNYGLTHWALETMGSSKVGLWMAMNRISDVFNIPILAVANTILLPLLSGYATNNEALRNILRPIFGKSLLGLAPGMVLLFLIYPYLMPVLFSSKFVTQSNFTFWQLIGDFFKSSSYVVSILILAQGHTRFYFWLESSSVFLTLTLSIGLYSLYGFEGMFIAHSIRFVIYWMIIVWKYHKILI